MKVREIMSAPPITVSPTDTLAFAEELMNVERIRHLPVVDGDVLVGLLSQRDLLAASISTLSNPSEEDDLELKRHVDVTRLMRGIVETATLETPVEKAAETLLEHKVGCLPVIDERHHLVGIVTSADFVKLARELITAPAPARPPLSAVRGGGARGGKRKSA
ncbi:CBS domain protein [Minicystis rosea]|nr:CBS domain protein [Minicystis rosea]